MKILTLRLCNLAAFAGEHTLDFTQSPLAECGLFAITGPTGSGKSTLLDAMCLALFGSTPRLRQMPTAGTLPQDDNVQLRDPRTLLRRGCSHAFAEVIFEGIDHQRYSAIWSVRRARNSTTGKMQASQQVLSRLDPKEQVLTDGKQDFSRKLPEVLGLTFDQFTRAVLLAQAEFSAFLKANDNERSALLERLTDSDIYSRLSRKAYQQYRTVKQRHVDLAADLEQAQPSDTAARTQLNNEVLQAHSTLKYQQAELVALEDQQRLHTQQRALVHAYYSQQKSFVTLDQQWQQLQPDQERCAALDRFAPLRDTVQEWHELHRQHTPLEETLQYLTQTVETTRKAYDLAQQKWQETYQQRQQLEIQQKEESPQLDAAMALEQHHHFNCTRLQDVRNTHATLEKQHQQYRSELQHLERTHQSDQTALKSLYDQLSRLTSQPPSVRLRSLRQRTKALEQLHQRWKQRQERAQQKVEALHALEEQRTQQQQAQAQLERCEQHSEILKQALSAAESHHQQLHDALLAYSEDTLSALRRLLIKDAPCPVCGSSSHSEQAQPSSALMEAQREAAQHQLAPAQQALTTAQQRYEEAQRQNRAAELALTKQAAHCDQLAHKAQLLTDQSGNFSLTICQQRAASLHQRHQQTQQQLEALEQCLADYQALSEQQQKIEQQRSQLKGAEQQSAGQLATSAQQQQELIQLTTLQHEQLRAMLKTYSSAQCWKKDHEEKLQQARYQEQSSLERLEAQRTELAQAQQAQQAHHAQWQSHCSRLTALSNRISEWQALQPQAWQPDEALKQLSEITTAEYAALKKRLSTIEVARNEADIRQQTYRQQCKDQLQDAQRRLLETPEALIEILDRELADLSERQQLQQQKVNDAQKAYETVRIYQAEDDQRQQRYAELTKKHRQAEQELERWGKISGLIGSADGALFRKMAQQWHLDVLVAHANRHLQTLARRFSLKRGGTELGLLIVDREMGDEERSVHSLSGGETFLVSLALALGLAAMTSDRLVIGTLFIDEGFGSLDTRSRAMAMDALEALQAQGRQVGIISHVQELHERIPVQIQVFPGGQEGSSQLKISAPRSLLDFG